MKHTVNLVICSALSTMAGIGIGFYCCGISKNAALYRRGWNVGAHAGQRIRQVVIEEAKNIGDHFKKEFLE